MIDLYPWTSVTLSLVGLALFSAHWRDAARAYQEHHDDRAAIEKLIFICLTIASLGLAISASASFIDALGVAGRAELRNLGLGIVRGSLLVLALVLFLIDRYPRFLRLRDRWAARRRRE